MKVVAIIPARGGSKSIPRKNLANLNGQPLINYTIQAAQKSQCFVKIIVSTDDEEIANHSQQLGADVIIRPAELATDLARSEGVVLHACETLLKEGASIDTFMMLQPTSPLRTAQHIIQALDKFKVTGVNSLVSVQKLLHPPHKTLVRTEKGIEPLINYEMLGMPRQLLPDAFALNGAIYIGKTQAFLQKQSFFMQPVEVFEMSKQESADIDTFEDIKVIESS